jgi:hypothetical protein
VSSVAPAGPTCIHTTPINLNFVPLVGSFLAIAICTRGRIYISRDVIFDELVFPFASLHPTVGAHYTSDVLLILGDNEITNPTNVSTISTLPVFDLLVQVLLTSSCMLNGASNNL